MKTTAPSQAILNDLGKQLSTTKEINDIAAALAKNGYQAFLVGGCLRDLLLKKSPTDWDIATNATPEKIQKIFPDSVYENKFGTVAVKTESADPALKIIEVTAFRLEGKYTDKRHPDEIKFAKTIEEDLSRRDFTINAIALEINSTKNKNSEIKLVDPFNGLQDLKNKLIQCVGEPEQRLEEDALRLMRAVRFGAQLNFLIDKKTAQAIKGKSHLLEFIAKERINGELQKLLLSDKADEGILQLYELNLLKHIWPELEEGIGVGQNKHHIYTIFEHNLKALQYATQKRYSLAVRVAALLHDIGKSRTKQGDGPNSTFYGHQVVGEKMALRMMDRLHFPKEPTEKVALLIREHMFVYDPETVTLAGVRRLLKRVGLDNIDDLLKLREADRIGSGVPKAQPYRLRYLQAMIEKVKTDPIGAKMLKVNGEDVMKIAAIEPSPKVGKILAILLEEVLEDPDKNEKRVLVERIKEIGGLNDSELEKLAQKAKQTAGETQKRIDEEIKKKYFVK